MQPLPILSARKRLKSRFSLVVFSFGCKKKKKTENRLKLNQRISPILVTAMFKFMLISVNYLALLKHSGTSVNISGPLGPSRGFHTVI